MFLFFLLLKKPTHDHGIPKNPEIPEELKKALEKNKKAKLNFEKYSNSTKKMTYRWILRAKRKEIAQRENVAAFIIFGDKSLKDMALKRPQTDKEFLAVFGVGEKKRDLYGPEMMETIKKFNKIQNQEG